MRSAPWTALALPLLVLLSSPAAARELPAARVLQQRTIYWVLGTAPVELHVAPGTTTTVRLKMFPELRSLELTEGRSTPQLHPIGGSSFSISPPGDFAVGERALVTVKLGTPAQTLPLLLVSREDVVDGEVQFVQLRAPTPKELDVDAVARVLSATPQGRLSLALKGPRLRGSKVQLQVESILRLDSHVFVTLVGYPVGESRTTWKLERARLRVLLEGGAQVEVPLLIISSPSKGTQQQRHTLIAPLPVRFMRLFLAVEGEGAPEDFFPLPSGEETPSP
jgi:hypothetical protein